MRAAQLSEAELPPRSARETASEIGALILGILTIAAVIVTMCTVAFGGAPVLAWLVAAGEVLCAQLGWTLGLYVTVLVAFYAVSIGGQVIGGGAAVARARRRLGGIAELMAAATVPVVLLVALYCVFHPPVWAVFFVVLPVVGVVFFLAIQLGAFIVPDRETRVADAAAARAWARLRMAALSRRSRRQFWLVLLVNSVVIGMLSALFSVAVVPLVDSVELWALHSALALLLLGMNAWALYSFRTRTDLFSAVVMFAAPAFLYGVLFVSGFVVTTVLSPGIVATAVTTLLTSFWPRSWGPRFVHNWTIQGSATALAARTVAKKYVAATREYLALTAQPPGPPSPLQRLRDGIRSLRAGGAVSR